VCGRGVFWGSATPLPQGCGAQALPSFGGSFYLCTHPLSQNYQVFKSDVVTQCHVGKGRGGEGRGVYLRGSHASHPKRVEFQRSSILGFLHYYCIHHLTQNDQFGMLTHGGQPRHCVCINASHGLSVIPEFHVIKLFSQFQCSPVIPTKLK